MSPARSDPVHPTEGPTPRLEFAADNSFHLELRRRVDEFLRSTGRRPRDCWQMYVKTAIILAWFAAAYVLLVFWAATALQGLLLAVVLAVATAGIGFDIQHDASHRAYSARPWVNRLMAMTMDLIGGSSYVWHRKHVVVHHRYVNITGYDTDIDLGILARLSPHQRWRPYHRWQHLYIWPFYGLVVVKWQLETDFRVVICGYFGPHRLPRPRGWDLVNFVAGKAVFLTLAFVLPMIFHPVWVVLFYYAMVALLMGVLMSMVFEIPHVVAGAEFPMPRPDTGRIEVPWAVHQARATLDFGRNDRAATWFLGGLNYHREHHLLPLVCHVNYPALAGLVDDTCREFGVQCAEHRSFWSGLAAHYRWLRRMGRPGAGEAA